MFEGLGDAIDSAYKFIIFSLLVLLPLSIWKLIDIGIWLYNHINVTIK